MPVAAKSRSEQTAEAIAVGLDPAAVGLRADRLDRLLNGRILPVLGLHAALIGAYLLVRGYDASAGLAVAFAALAALLGLLAWLFRERDGGDVPVPVAGAVCTLVTLAAFAAPISPLALVAAVAIVHIGFAVLALLGRVATAQLSFPPIYLAAFVVDFMNGGALAMPVAYALPFLAVTLVLWRRDRMQHAFGVFLGAIIVMSGELYHRTSAEFTVIALSVMILIALVAYEIRVGAMRASNLRGFLSQGLAMATLLVAVLILVPETVSGRLLIWAATAALYLGVMTARVGTDGGATRLTWLVIAVAVALWENAYGKLEDPRMWLRILVSMALVLLLVWGARRLQNGFAHNVARLAALLLGLSVFLALRERVEDFNWMVAPARREPSSPQDIVAAFDGALLIGVGLAVLGFLLASYASREVRYPRAVPWWRGMVRPRHAALARRAIRASGKQIGRLPFIGSFGSIGLASFRSLRYLKGDGQPLRPADITVVAGGVLAALAMAQAFELAIGLAGPGGAAPWLAGVLPLAPGAAAVLVSWLLWATVMYVWGLVAGRTLLLFTGVAFALVPAVRLLIVDKFPTDTGAGAVVLGSGLTLVLFGLVRRRR